MSFAGGGSDLKEYYKQTPGSVISTSIDKYVYVMLNKKFDNYIRIGYSQTEYVNSINEIGHNIIRETLKKLDFNEPGLDIVYMADVLPRNWGTGLGFSSSLTVGLANAIFAYRGEKVSPEQLAQIACEIEIDILHSPIGKQDQYAAAYGGLNYINFYPDESVEVTPLDIPKATFEELSKNLLLFFTGLSSDSNTVLSEQKKNTLNNNSVKKNLDLMTSLAAQFKDIIQKGNIDQVGSILHEGWMSKQKLATKISNEKINSYYNKAIQAGAEGGKLLGSGGGGFLLFYCQEKYQNNLRESICLQELPFNFESLGSSIIKF